MEQNFQKILFPTDLEYASDGNYLPIEFYLNVLPASKEIYLKLGYFSSSAIKTLSYGFAQFIHNGGRIKIISNHYMYNQDKELLQKNISAEDAAKKEYLLSDLAWISNELNSSQRHFFNCLKLLVSLEGGYRAMGALIKSRLLEIVLFISLPSTHVLRDTLRVSEDQSFFFSFTSV